MYDDKNAEGVGVGPILPFSHTPNNNYTPSPIDRLTTHSVDQRILSTLERIEALLVRATGTTGYTQGLHQSPNTFPSIGVQGVAGVTRPGNYEDRITPETGKRGGKRSPAK